jgi:hypothetical protein
MTRKQRTPEEKKALIQKIDILCRDGLTIKRACEKAKIHQTQYYKFKRESGSATKVVTYNGEAKGPVRKYVRAKSKSVGKLIALIGSPEEVMNALKGI